MPGFDGTDYCWIPDTPISRSEEWRLDVASFGDGYSQRMLDGINALDQTWSVTFESRHMDVIKAMLAFLAATKGNSFQFREPVTGILYDVVCDKWQVDWVIRRKGPSPVNPIYYGTLSAEFARIYGITG